MVREFKRKHVQMSEERILDQTLMQRETEREREREGETERWYTPALSITINDTV